MVEKELTISETAYETLETIKHEDEDFSDVILRLGETEAKLTHDGGVDRAALSETEKAALEAIERKLDAESNEDIKTVLEVCHPELREATKTQLSQLWSQYDLDYEFTIKDVETQEENLVAINVLQTIRKVSGPEFKDNTSLERNFMQKFDEGWLLVDSETEEMDMHG